MKTNKEYIKTILYYAIGFFQLIGCIALCLLVTAIVIGAMLALFHYVQMLY